MDANYKEYSLKKPHHVKHETLLYFIIALVPLLFIETFIHEIGHAIAALCFGWKIDTVHLTMFPFVFNIDNGFISYYPSLDAMLWQKIIVVMSGSMHSLFWGFIFFLLYYFKKLPKFLEVFFFTYSIILGLETIVYLLFDVFILKMGDFYYLYVNASYIPFIILTLGIVIIALFVKNLDKVIKRWDI